MGSNRASSLLVPASPADPSGGIGGSLLPLLSISLAALLWAIAAAAAARLFDRGVDPIELVEARAVISAAGLSLLPAAWARPARPARRTFVLLGVAIALVNAAYYLAIDRLAVAVAIVLQYAGPPMVVAWTALSERRRPEARVAGAVAAAFVGVVLISELPGGDLGRLDLVGIGCGLGAAVTFAAYTIQSEKTQRVYGTLGALRRAFAVAAAFWIAVQLPRGFPEDLVGENLPLVLFVGVGGTLIPFVLYIWGVKKLRSERAVIAATLEPLFAGLIAWWWLGQVLSLMQVVGGVLIMSAVVALQLRRGPRAPAAVPTG